MNTKDTIKEEEKRVEILINYLLMKIDERDWHAVSDAAIDIQVMEGYIEGLKEK